ncbi:hypothetical protein E2C01_018914 [Portunus trituberculatus]|uniref:Uncharacterized protein n=1 Tax=Portunus trituberculatus TaxID=210409 RepID=A0A5B7DVX4_PORTR|nr:hypothetical protein [Portunus trituberculatus]
MYIKYCKTVHVLIIGTQRGEGELLVQWRAVRAGGARHLATLTQADHYSGQGTTKIFIPKHIILFQVYMQRPVTHGAATAYGISAMPQVAWGGDARQVLRSSVIR